MAADVTGLRAAIRSRPLVAWVGRVTAIGGRTLSVSGLSPTAALGDLVEVLSADDRTARGEIIAVDRDHVTVLPEASTDGLTLGQPVRLAGPMPLAPSDDWLGRVIDPFGRPIDGHPLMNGPVNRPVAAAPPDAIRRRPLGARLETGLSVFNTFLPLVRGQRIGLFAGSGVGKSTLLAQLARGVEADVVVLALVGERGREVRHFVDHVLGATGLARAVVVAATSDMSPLVRRRCLATAMTVAEHFRDGGRHVLFLADSVTRFAEAHREVAFAAGEAGNFRGYPPSIAHAIPAICERAGPGVEGQGDITAVFSVLVAGSDMEEPVADVLRGVLDGHVVLDREIAERGRFPAIDLLRSVSRALPDAASPEENAALAEGRRRLGAYARGELMVRSGLYVAGSDPALDAAVATWPDLDAFIARREPATTADSFAALAQCLDPKHA